MNPTDEKFDRVVESFRRSASDAWNAAAACSDKSRARELRAAADTYDLCANELLGAKREADAAAPCALQYRMIGTPLVFAARYAHDRNTGAALAVVSAVKHFWPCLNESTRDMLVRESHEATCNLEEWEELRKFALSSKQDRRDVLENPNYD